MMAIKILHTSVGHHVSVKTVFPGKCFPTLLALKLCRHGVGERVFPEISLTSTHCLTVVTPQPCLAGMGKDVSGNISLGGTHFPTLVTSVHPDSWGCLLLLVLAAGAPAKPRFHPPHHHFWHHTCGIHTLKTTLFLGSINITLRCFYIKATSNFHVWCKKTFLEHLPGILGDNLGHQFS